MLKVPKFELEKIVLKTIHEAPGVVFADDSVHEATLTHAVRQRLPAEETISNIQVAELVWSLIAHGLVYIDFSNRNSINWRLHVTDMGLAALKDESINPDNRLVVLDIEGKISLIN